MENSMVAWPSAWVNALRKSVAEEPEANCGSAVATSLTLPANVIRWVAETVCADKEIEKERAAKVINFKIY